jgi:hypothetical protein
MTRLVAALLIVLPVWASAAEPPLVEKFLTDGKLAEGQERLEAHLKTQPSDDQARFGLGGLQFLRGVENLGQSLYKFGALGAESRLARQIPLLRLAVPKNPAPEKIKYADVRAIFQKLIDDLSQVEATLSEIKDDNVKLPLHFGLIALDLNGDGQAGGDETLWRAYATLNSGLRLTPDATPEEVQSFVITFDRGDVYWLRGYCHLLCALCEAALAYDEEQLFAAIAQQLFDDPDAPRLPAELLRQDDEEWMDDIADAIAGIHLARFPVKEPARMKAAHQHLTQVISLSRESWAAIKAEKDNDCEWIPNSTQGSVIPNVRVSAEMIVGWQRFLDEADALLQGKKLVPHWRFKPEYGINLRRVFEEPREFDLVLWAHGAAAVPYAEKGTTTSPETWLQFQQMFRGQFIGFALWFN